ncbi:MAG: DNA translocase FtsK [Dehalococcoidales bacterium]
MAGKRVNTRKKTKARSSRDKSKGSPGKKLSLGGLFRFLILPLVRRLILLAFILTVLFWQWPALASWADEVTESTLGMFGWGGLILIAVAVIIVVGIVFRQRLSDFIQRWKLYQWNKWLGATAFLFAVWGMLALLDLGGSFGLAIIGDDRGLIGILRILGLAATGFIIVAPRASFRAVKKSVSWFAKPFKMPSPVRSGMEKFQPPLTPLSPPVYTTPATPEKAPPAEKIIPPQVLVPPEIPIKEQVKEPKTGVTAAARAQEADQPPRDLRQVAQEVWKKYGESPSLVTIDGWRLPPIDILDKSPEVEFGQADNFGRAKLIEDALASYGVDAKVVQINAGPTVTQFGIEPGWDRKVKDIKERDADGNIHVRQEEVSRTRVKVDRITSLANDLALALAAPSIRIEAPVPGKPIVGIEVPNTISSVVSLRGVIETSAFQKIMARSKLALALGKGAGGEAVAADLAKMPHLLIAGATGSGKTVCLNAVICCLLLYGVPSELKFIMIDPKRVELTLFNSLPHLATPVIVDTQKALGALRWLNQEMDKRYRQLAAAGIRNIEAYNKGKQGEERMPHLILVIDELADLMMTGFDEVEHILCRLAQLARAVGIHLVVATQRPSVDVVTGLIKANFPTRISFAVTSQVDSRTILDGGGAEKLLGRGDMLYMPTEAAKPKRLQGCFVSDAEVERLVYFWGSQKQGEEAVSLKVDAFAPPVTAGQRGGYPQDPLLESARQLAEEHTQISTSYLQRKLHIGYPRAARIMEQLEEESDKGAEA